MKGLLNTMNKLSTPTFPTNNTFSDLILAIKGNRTLEEFSRDTGVSIPTLSRFINAHISRPNTNSLKKLINPASNPECIISLEELLATLKDANATSEKNISSGQKMEFIISGALYNHFFSHPNANCSFSSFPLRHTSPWDFGVIRSEKETKVDRPWFFIFKTTSNVAVAKAAMQNIVWECMASDAPFDAKISVVVTNKTLFSILSQTYLSNYNGDLSIILFDIQTCSFVEEIYIANVEDCTFEEFYITE